MIVKELVEIIESNKDSSISIMLPDGKFIPAHFHITEIGRVDKKFIDCGGTRRERSTCVLQAWVATDTEHRLNAGKLAKIFQFVKASSWAGLAGLVLVKGDDLPVEIEYNTDSTTQYPLGDVEVTPAGLLFVLGTKKTECLAPDKCGVTGCC